MVLETSIELATKMICTEVPAQLVTSHSLLLTPPSVVLLDYRHLGRRQSTPSFAYDR